MKAINRISVALALACLCLLLPAALAGQANDFKSCGFDEIPLVGPFPPPPPSLLPGSACVTTVCDDPVIRNGHLFSASPIYTVHLNVHVLRDGAGIGASLDSVVAMLEKCQRDFDGSTASTYDPLWTGYDTGIRFCWTVNVVNNSTWASAHPFALPGLVGGAPYLSQVNVYVSGQTAYSADGVALSRAIGSLTLQPFVWVGNGQAGSTQRTLSHEVGHFLGLYHTFYQVGCNTICGLDSSSLQENLGQPLASRDTLNDRCSDTDPDPGYIPLCAIGYTYPSVCGWTSTGTTVFNIMQYGAHECAVYFTPQQAARMRCVLVNSYSSALAFTALGCPNKPTADFSRTPPIVCVGAPVSFTDESWSESPITQWQWDFGDGSGSTITTAPSDAVHSYSAPGTYTVTLTVTNAAGNMDSYTWTACVRVQDGIPLPFYEPFDTLAFTPTRWGREDRLSGSTLPGWSDIRAIKFGGGSTAIPTTGPDAYTFREPGSLYGGTNTYPIIGHEGYADTTAAYFTDIFNTVDGDSSTLFTPILEVGTVSNPILRFWYSFVHVGDTNLAVACNIEPSTDPVVPRCNPADPPCGYTVSPIFTNQFTVYVTTDCGATWSAVYDKTGMELNTESGNTCDAYGYFPDDSTDWRKVEIDLCPYLGAAKLQFRFRYRNSDYSGNFYMDDVYVGPSAPPLISVSTTVTDDCGLGYGGITATASGGVAPYTYTLTQISTGWDSTTATGIFADLAFGDYFVFVTDNDGNCAQKGVTVGLTPTMGVTATIADDCGTGTGSISASAVGGAAPYTFYLSTIGGSPTSGGPTWTGLSAGCYVVYVEDMGGLCGLDTFCLYTTATLSPTFSYTPDTCGRGVGSITLGADPPVTWPVTATLLDGSGAIVAGPSSFTGSLTFMGLSAMTYTVEMTDADSRCISFAFTLPYYGTLPLGAIVMQPECLSGCGSILIPSSFGAGATYTIRALPSGVPFAGSSPVYPCIYPGTYEVSADGPLGCAFDTITIVDPILLAVSTTTTNETCILSNGTLTATAVGAGPFTYVLFDSTLTPLDTLVGMGGVTFTGLVEGVYSVTVESPAPGCGHARDTVVFVPGLIELYLMGSTLPSCGALDGTATIDIYDFYTGCADTLGLHFTNVTTGWDSTGGIFLPPWFAGTLFLTGLDNGVYHVTASGCGDCGELWFTLNADTSNVPVAYTVQATSDCYTDDGSISLTIVGTGSHDVFVDGPFGYSLDTVAGSVLVLDSLAAGGYSISVLDGLGRCTEFVVAVDSGYCCIPQFGTDYLLGDAKATDLIALAGTTLTGEVITLHGTFEYDATMNFDNCVFSMGPGAKIIMQPGTDMILNASVFDACADTLWDGIYIPDTSALVFADVTTWRSAEHALVSISGGRWDLAGCVFERNYTGIEARPWGLPHLGYVSGTTFDAGAGMLVYPRLGQRSRFGITADRVRSLIVGDPAAAANRFTRLNTGILTDRVNLTLHNNQFVGMATDPGVAESGVGVRYRIPIFPGLPGNFLMAGTSPGSGANGFQSCRKGIESTGRAAVTVRHSSFGDCRQGVSISSVRNERIRVDSCNFQQCDTAIYGRGWRVSGTVALPSSITRNNINHVGNAATRGIYLVNDSAGVLEVRANAVTNQGIGIFVNDWAKARLRILNNTVTSTLSIGPVGIDLWKVNGLAGPSPSLDSVQVRDNFVSLYGTGIFGLANAHVNIESNDVNMVPTVTTPIPHRRAVWVSGSQYTRLDDNFITGNAATRSNSDNRGIELVGCRNTVVTCNCLTDMGWSMDFVGDLRPIGVFFNYMNRARVGTVLYELGWLGEQGDFNTRSGNVWGGSYLSSRTLTAGSNGILSRFWVRPGASTLSTSNDSTFTLTSGTGPRFRFSTASNADRMTLTCECPVPFITADAGSGSGGGSGGSGARMAEDIDAMPALLAIATGANTYPVFEAESKWWDNLWFHDYVATHPSLLSNASILTHWNYLNTQQVSKVCHVNMALALQNDGLALATAGGMSPTCKMELQSKLFAQLNAALLDREPTPSERASLREMAMQCPLTGGPAVYQSRALLAQFGEIIREGEDCTPGASGKVLNPDTEQEGQQPRVSVYPQPAQESFTVQFEMGDSQTPAHWEAWSLVGQRMAAFEVSESMGEVLVDAAGWPKGVYLWRMTLADGTVVSGRLTLQ